MPAWLVEALYIELAGFAVLAKRVWTGKALSAPRLLPYVAARPIQSGPTAAAFARRSSNG